MMRRGVPGTEIINDGASLRIVKPAGVILVSKLHIKTIDTIKDEIVRLNIGEGPLKNIYIRFAEVVYPTGLDNAAQLRDEINYMLLNNVNGTATEVKQDSEINILANVLTTLNDIKTAISNIQCGCNTNGQIMRIDESIPLITYYGYATAGSLPNQAVWSIKKITRSAATDIVTTEWADGNELFDNIWDERYNLIYAAINIPSV
jgi:hypothetical protein